MLPPLDLTLPLSAEVQLENHIRLVDQLDERSAKDLLKSLLRINAAQKHAMKQVIKHQA